MENKKENIYKEVLEAPGSHQISPIHCNSNGEYLRKDLVFKAMDEYAKELIYTLIEISFWGEVNGDFKAHAKRALNEYPDNVQKGYHFEEKD